MTTTDTDCLFCRMARGEVPVEPLYQDDDVFALRDINPRAPTHLLVIPTRHIASARDLREADDALLGKMFRLANRLAVEDGVSERGYRLAFNVGEEGGQTIFHIHLHVLGGRPLGAEG